MSAWKDRTTDCKEKDGGYKQTDVGRDAGVTFIGENYTDTSTGRMAE